jgi:catechol 2,3-dioxygenase-like lactoylglutathione lyase family enzyme
MPRPALIPQQLHHAAWVTQDAAATADFYTRVLGMELASTVMDDRVPSTGDAFPYFHIFFRMADGSTIAFFEGPDIPPRIAASHPAYDVFDHFAMQLPSREAVEEWRDWLIANGVDVVGPTNHGIIYSIYFHDPNGLRLELTTSLDPQWNHHTEQAQADLRDWVATKEQAKREGKDVSAALLQLIHERRRVKVPAE